MISLPVITQWLANYGYFVLFPTVVVEGPIATVIAGLLASLGTMNFFVAYAVVVAGDLAGDCIYYAIGRWGRESFVEKYGRYVGIKVEHVRGLEDHFAEHSGKTLAVGKLLHGIGAAFLVAAGIVRMSFAKYFLYNLLATFPKSLLLMLVGFYFGAAIVNINDLFELTAVITIGAAGVILLTYLVYEYGKRRI